MAEYRVAVSDYVFPDILPEKAVLEPMGVEITAKQCKSVEELISITRDADVLLNCYFKPVGEDVFKNSPKLKAVVRYGIGVDTIDIKAATAFGVMVANVPDYCIDEVSDHTVALMLCLARKISISDRTVKAGDYSLSCLKPLFKLRGQTVGFLGFGRIARMVAQKISCFGCNMIFYDKNVRESRIAEKAGFEAVLLRSDFLLIHLPETSETRKILNLNTLAKMKPGAFLINTARGGIVDTEALVEMLSAGRLSGAALDLIEGVPPISSEHPLCKMDNVILTPHSAWYSESAITELQRKAAEEAARVIRGEAPKSLLNPEVSAKKRV